MAREAPEPDLRTVLAQRGLSLAAAERAAGLARGSLSRLLAGRRGRGLRMETVRRLSRATGIPLDALADAFEISLASASERRRQLAAVEQAILEAELRP